MLTYQEARYVVTEIARRPFYKEQLQRISSKMALLEERKLQLSMPNCPQGHEYIGAARGNEVTDFSKALTEIVTRQQSHKAEQDFFEDLLIRATKYYDMLLEGEESQYVRDYFETVDKRELQLKYNISNAYDRMIRIVRSTIKRV